VLIEDRGLGMFKVKFEEDGETQDLYVVGSLLSKQFVTPSQQVLLALEYAERSSDGKCPAREPFRGGGNDYFSN
jgi:hypothetical protein